MDQTTLDFMRKIDLQLGDLKNVNAKFDTELNAAAGDAAIASARQAFATIKQFVERAGRADK